MLKTLRSNTKWIMIIVVVSFVGMIIIGWGMDITGSRSGVQQGIVGMINSQKITYEVYNSYINDQRQRYSRGAPLTLEMERRINDETWNYIITRTLIEQDIEKRKISYTEKELISFIRNNPVNVVYQVPMFQEDGSFSLEKYQAFLDNPVNYENPQTAQLLRYIEMDAMSRLPDMKFQNSLASAVIVTDTQVRERWLRQDDKCKAEWVFLGVNRLSNIGTTPDPEDIRIYYAEHKEEYERGERRTLDTVFFPLAPTVQDSSDILDRAKLLVERARRGEDFPELADSYSEDPGNTDNTGNRGGGDLGFFQKGRMVKEFEDAAFTLNPGEISEPTLSAFGYHIIKVDSIKYKEDNEKEIDQIKARHILLKIEPSRDTRDDVENRVNAFYEAVRNSIDFMAKAEIDSLSGIHTAPFEEDAQFIQGIGGNVQILVHRAFQAKSREVLPVYPTDGGYFVIRVADILEEGTAPLEEVIQEVENAVREEIRARYAEEFIRRVYDRVTRGQSLTEAVEADSVKTASVSNQEVYPGFFIAGLGENNSIMAKICNLENPGDNTGPVVTEDGSGIGILIEKLPIDEEKFEKDREKLRQTLETEIGNDIISKYLEGLVDKAEIVDNRYLILYPENWTVR
ncbi:peptidylprolyl isomerase [Candidatus Latescibacterota bacterium]